jgi:hypothetical protein
MHAVHCILSLCRIRRIESAAEEPVTLSANRPATFAYRFLATAMIKREIKRELTPKPQKALFVTERQYDWHVELDVGTSQLPWEFCPRRTLRLGPLAKRGFLSFSESWAPLCAWPRIEAGIIDQ